ncbi:unnamed protein product [Rhodiola kirilowii]
MTVISTRTTAWTVQTLLVLIMKDVFILSSRKNSPNISSSNNTCPSHSTHFSSNWTTIFMTRGPCSGTTYQKKLICHPTILSSQQMEFTLIRPKYSTLHSTLLQATIWPTSDFESPFNFPSTDFSMDPPPKQDMPIWYM